MALRNNGVKVVSATENISDKPEGRLVENVIIGVNEYYSAELSQKVKRGPKWVLIEHSVDAVIFSDYENSGIKKLYFFMLNLSFREDFYIKKLVKFNSIFKANSKD